jgi:hypothetical protein
MLLIVKQHVILKCINLLLIEEIMPEDGNPKFHIQGEK